MYIYTHTYLFFFQQSDFPLLADSTMLPFSKSQVCSAKRWNVNGPKYKREVITMKLQHIKGHLRMPYKTH